MLISRYSTLLSLLALGLTLPSALQAAPPALPQEKVAYFEKHIRPAFVKYCYECHSESSGKTRGGLLVDTSEGLLQGGDSGPAVVAGSVDESVLWNAITWTDYQMPPKGKMPAEVIARFKTWIEMGAPDPRVREQTVVKSRIDIEQGKQHWSFQPPSPSPDASIDSLIATRLASAGMKPVEPADPATLLRRLNFDLTGLPPTPLEVFAFQDAWEEDPDAAVEAKVDELLARPQFGERWGRHWLDVARYAESTGKDVNFTFPHAWRYRDYVIDSFNQDKPYDQFIREQIAGDLMPAASDRQRQEQLIATGFLAIGTKGLNERNPRTFKMDVADEQIDVMSQAVLGITVACARCHDHKFDPIPTTDYYALAGIFLSTKTLYGTAGGAQNRRPADLRALPLTDPTPVSRTYSRQYVENMREQAADLRQEAREFRIAARRNRDQASRREFARARIRIAQLESRLDSLDRDGIPKTQAMGVQEADAPLNAHVLVGGDVERSAQQVQRGFLQVLDQVEAGPIGRKESGRRELADWLTSRQNPLTARVMVNRLWLHLFGEGLVDSPNNWGVTGSLPTHPELLDYLAIRFIEHNWSIKAMIREIVLTDTYQRSSTSSQTNYAADPDNKLLWRASPRQLDAEALRDAMLAVSGNLDVQRPLGSVVAEFGDTRVGRQLDESRYGKFNYHRSVYLPVVRDALPESLALFDFAEPSLTSAKRDATNVPSQALYLMNNSFVTEQAADMAAGLSSRFKDVNQCVEAAFLEAYGRSATSDEMKTSLKYLRRFVQEAHRAMRERPARKVSAGQVSVASASAARQEALAMFCQSLLASAEFRILN